MFRQVVASATLLLFALSMAGCTTFGEEHKGATTGAAVGATTGAVAGAVLAERGAKTETAIIGGLLGALVGGAIGHYAYDTKRTEKETADRYSYQPNSATVRIEDVSVSPSRVRPGDKVDLHATYAVLGSSPNVDISVTEIREIRFGNDLVGKPEASMTRRGGTYTSTVPIYLPRDAKRGTYKLLTVVQAGNARDSRETSFFVE